MLLPWSGSCFPGERGGLHLWWEMQTHHHSHTPGPRNAKDTENNHREHTMEVATSAAGLRSPGWETEHCQHSGWMMWGAALYISGSAILRMLRCFPGLYPVDVSSPHPIPPQLWLSKWPGVGGETKSPHPCENHYSQLKLLGRPCVNHWVAGLPSWCDSNKGLLGFELTRPTRGQQLSSHVCFPCFIFGK